MMGWLRWVVMVVVVMNGRVRGAQNVEYDGKSLIIDGQHKLLFSGSIHYPRSTPQMWPSLIAKAKEGGIDVIQTYVFWNQHEPQPGQYNFQGRYDLVSFIKEVQKQGLYATLRIGPFIEAEWTYGGLPFWLHDVPGIVYRSDNQPFKNYMQNFTTKIVNMMKSQGLYASQGGPIILSQIENEYHNVEGAFHEKGPPYVRWAAQMAVGLQTGVPWVMCKQDDAPDPVINACNGMKCGETFVGPNSPNKPAIWTENWTSFYQAFGGEPYIRSAQDIAYHVALFIAKKGGSYINYYMYHGGTNFGRTGAAYMTTSYYDQAPLDEYGLIRQPKWGHLKELHSSIKLISETLLNGVVSNVSLSQKQMAYVFQGKSGDCAAFLINNEQRHPSTIEFQNSSYQVPPSSISILLNCKNVIFNTATVSTETNSRATVLQQKFDAGERWKIFKDVIPSLAETALKSNSLLEHMATTKDASDYLWYILSFEHTESTNAEHILHINSLGHVVHAFVNDIYVGNSHGSHSANESQGCFLDKPIKLNNGTNNISILSVMVGLPDSGAYLEKRFAGLRRVRIDATGEETQDFGNSLWGYQVGLSGEKSQIYTDEGLNRVQWSNLGSSSPLTWYKTTFDAPQEDDPVVLDLGSMGKGEAWVNGQSIGRYWSSFYTDKGHQSQTLYHIPRSFLKQSGNLLVLLEEINGNPLNISIDTVSTDKVCGHVTDSHLPPVNSWEVLKRSGELHKHHGIMPRVQLECPLGRTISKILFASFGTPFGNCQNYAVGRCHSPNSRRTVEMACLGRRSCFITKSAKRFGGDPCPGVSKSLLIHAQCG